MAVSSYLTGAVSLPFVRQIAHGRPAVVADSKSDFHPTVPDAMTSSQHVYEIRPRKDKRGVDLISDALPFGRLWYGESGALSNAIGYAKSYSRSHDAVIRVYDEAGNMIETHGHKADFKEW